MDDL